MRQSVHHYHWQNTVQQPIQDNKKYKTRTKRSKRWFAIERKIALQRNTWKRQNFLVLRVWASRMTMLDHRLVERNKSLKPTCIKRMRRRIVEFLALTSLNSSPLFSCGEVVPARLSSGADRQNTQIRATFSAALSLFPSKVDDLNIDLQRRWQATKHNGRWKQRKTAKFGMCIRLWHKT